MHVGEEGQTLNTLYIKQDVAYDVVQMSVMEQGRYVTPLFL